MTNIAIENGNQTLTWGRLLRSVFHFPSDKSAAKREASAPAEEVLTDQTAELIEKIENGYMIDDTGQLTQFPRLARTHLKTIVKTGGWE